MPTLSIITVNYNNNKGLIASIESIKQQSFTDYEHIIIDAGSTDGSLETIKQYAEESSHLSFWCSEPDKGVYDGMNKGIEHASGVQFFKLRRLLKKRHLTPYRF
jgi:putative colanic acid biosynthesis glycosyltransferase